MNETEPTPEQARAQMERAHKELEDQSLESRWQAGNAPTEPVKSPEDIQRERELLGPEYVMPPEHQRPPAQLSQEDKEKLGLKEE